MCVLAYSPLPSAPALAGAAHRSPRSPAPYVFDTDQAADLAKAGADVLVPHMGIIGAQTTITLQDAALSVQGMHDAVKKGNPDSGAADTHFSTAICIPRYRIMCPCADPLAKTIGSATSTASDHTGCQWLSVGRPGSSVITGVRITDRVGAHRPMHGDSKSSSAELPLGNACEPSVDIR